MMDPTVLPKLQELAQGTLAEVEQRFGASDRRVPEPVPARPRPTQRAALEDTVRGIGCRFPRSCVRDAGKGRRRAAPAEREAVFETIDEEVVANVVPAVRLFETMRI